MKLAAYLRVSTVKQVEKGLSLPDQRDRITKWAKANGHKVTLWAVDEGISGAKDATERDGLAEALQAICDGTVAGLVLTDLDRFARSLTVQEAALGHVWQCGGRVFTLDGGEVLEDDPDDPVRTAMRQMRGVFHQLDKAMITKRLRHGRRLKAEKGGFAYGSPPFGYRAEDGELVPDADEQVIVEKVRLMADSDMSLRQIAEALNSAGHRPRRGQRWHPQTVSRMMQRFELADR